MATPPVPDSSFETAKSNLETLDKYLNNSTGPVTNREGVQLTPIPLINSQLNALVNSTAWLPLTGTFTTGATLTERNHILLNPANNQYYSWGGTLPKVVPASSTPATSGGISLNAWVLRQTDASLRSELGTAAFRNAMSSINDVSTVNALVVRGAFGLGATSGVSPPTISNLDALDIPAGSYRITSSIVGTYPFGNPNLSLIVCRYNSVDSLQLAGTVDNFLQFRHSAGGAWGAWGRLYSNNDLNYFQNVSGASVNPYASVAGSALSPAQTGTWRCWGSSVVVNNGYSIWKKVA